MYNRKNHTSFALCQKAPCIDHTVTERTTRRPYYDRMHHTLFILWLKDQRTTRRSYYDRGRKEKEKKRKKKMPFKRITRRSYYDTKHHTSMEVVTMHADHGCHSTSHELHNCPLIRLGQDRESSMTHTHTGLLTSSPPHFSNTPRFCDFPQLHNDTHCYKNTPRCLLMERHL